MKNHKRATVKKRMKKADAGSKNNLKPPTQKNVHKSDPKGWNRIESELVGLSKEIEMVDDEVIYKGTSQHVNQRASHL